MLNFVLDFLFPPVCVICGKIHKNWICEKCKIKIKHFEKFEYKNGMFYCFEYKDVIRKLLLQYKFFNKSYISYFFANEIFSNKKVSEIVKSYDIIIPVPLDKEKLKIRGYNQTELILSKKLKVDSKSLIKIKHTKTQSTLTLEERRNNIKGAFKVKDNKSIKNKKVILFDDIYTTGATVNEISNILKQAGAKEVLVLVIAKD